MQLTKISLALMVVSTIGMNSLSWAQDTESSLAPPNEERSRYLQKLQPDNCTLIMIDYLTGFDPGIRTIDMDKFQDNVTALASIGKIFDLPTVVLGDEEAALGRVLYAD